MNKVIVFDMDGTIANLYGVEGRLPALRSGDPTPYVNAAPLLDMFILRVFLNMAKSKGYRIVVTSWLSKESNKEYDTAVRKAKKDWLDKYNFPYDEIHLVKYGTTKANCTRKHGGTQILFDDNADVRKGWNLGPAYTEKEILKVLASI